MHVIVSVTFYMYFVNLLQVVQFMKWAQCEKKDELPLTKQVMKAKAINFQISSRIFVDHQIIALRCRCFNRVSRIYFELYAS